jgi:hypothetical protein
LPCFDLVGSERSLVASRTPYRDRQTIVTRSGVSEHRSDTALPGRERYIVGGAISPAAPERNRAARRFSSTTEY